MKKRASKELAENYAAFWRLNFDNFKTVVIANIWGVALLLASIFLFHWVANALRPGSLSFSISFSSKALDQGLLLLIELLVVTVVMIVVHEGLHGIFFWIFSGEPPVVGFKGYYAFAGAPGWYFPRGQYAVIGLAPIVGITLLGVLGMAFLPLFYVMPLFLLLIFNTSGAVGDLWVVLKLVAAPAETRILDRGDGVEFFAPRPDQTVN